MVQVQLESLTIASDLDTSTKDRRSPTACAQHPDIGSGRGRTSQGHRHRTSSTPKPFGSGVGCLGPVLGLYMVCVPWVGIGSTVSPVAQGSCQTPHPPKHTQDHLLSHVADFQGATANPDKVVAVREVELCSSPGQTSYYRRFFKDSTPIPGPPESWVQERRGSINTATSNGEDIR